ncbi:MAG: hypothetical protein JWQ27_1604 [Ferruginibacter sp.]|jgi:hypothetical protein|nr:hypothetical protein [Ferruginibacter sp.]
MLTKRSGLLLAGLAAYAAYKYSKMSPDQKENLFGGLKEKGRKLVDQFVPEDVKSKFSETFNSAANTASGFNPSTKM